MRFRYRFTALGWIGAALFVLPTPLVVWHYAGVLNAAERSLRFHEALREQGVDGGSLSPAALNAPYLTALATATLIGLVLVIVGRETVPS